MKIYFVRHAQKDNETKNSIEDHYNRSLTEVGILQAEELGNYLQTKNVETIYSSCMQRARQTLEIANKFISCNDVTYSDQLDEVDHCKIPSHPQRAVYKKLMQENWSYSPPYGESCLSGKSRIEKYFYDVILKKERSSVLVITHGRLLRLFLSIYFPETKNILDNKYYSVGISEMDCDSHMNKLTLAKYNSIDYLPARLSGI